MITLSESDIINIQISILDETIGDGYYITRVIKIEDLEKIMQEYIPGFKIPI